MAEIPARSPHEIGANDRADAGAAIRADGPADKRPGVLDTPVPFGRYYLLERLDHEGRTEVYRARAGGDDSKLVVVKRILSTVAASRAAMEQFAGEVEAAANLVHPTIARILDRGWVEGAYYVALEHVFGRDLRNIVKRLRERRERMPRNVATYLLMKACEGLAYAHVHRDATGRSPGLVHRNVSPQSILLGFDGDIKLINFGIARTMGRRGTTVSGIVKGTYGYMSPEQVRGLPIDPRSDIFSCGIVAYELLTGEHPFVGRDEFDMLEKVRTVEFVPPRVHAPDLPDELERIVCKALAKHADERYQRAVDLQEDLQAFLFASGALQARQELVTWLAGLFADGLAEDETKLARYRALSLAVRERPGGNEGLTEPMAIVEPPAPGPDTVDGMSPVPVSDDSSPVLLSQRRWDQADTRLYESNRPPPELVAKSAKRTLVDMAEPPRDTDMAVRLPRPPSVPPLGPPPGPPPVLPRSLPPNWDAVDSLSTAERTPPERMPPLRTPPERVPPLPPAPLAPTREYGAAMAEAAMAIAAEREATHRPEPAPAALTPPPVAVREQPGRGSARRILYISAGAIGAMLLVLAGALTSRYLLDPPAEPVALPGTTIAVGAAGAAGAPGAAGTAARLPEATISASGTPALPPEVLAATGFDLFVEPADATVKLDGKLLDLAAPMRIRDLAPGAHELLISAPSGFFSKTERIIVEAGQAPVVRIELDPIEVRGRFTSEPPGATVSLVGPDGEAGVKLGVTPVERVLDPRARYQAVFEKPGFETVRVDVNPGRGPELPVHATLAAAGEEAAVATAEPAGQAREPARESRSRQSARQKARQKERAGEQGASAPPDPAAGKTGVLMLGSKPPCRIYIDGQDTAKTTPQRSITLSAGRHTIKLVNRDFGIEETFPVTIEPGETTRVIKDMSDRIQ
jgi:serine/threonine protein kinase